MPDVPQIATGFYATQPTNKLMAPGEAMGQALQVAQGQQNLQTSQFQLAKQHLDLSLQLLGSIAADPTMENVARANQIMHSVGLPEDSINQSIQEFSKDPTRAGIRRVAINGIARHADVTQQLQLGGGAPPAMMTNGQQTFPVNVQSGQNPGISRASGLPIQQLIPPAAAASPVAGPPSPSGAPTTIPLGGFAERQGVVPPGTYTGGGLPIAAPAAPARAAGRTPSPAAPVAPVSPMATGLAPGQAEGMVKVGGGSGALLDRHLADAASYRTQVYPLETAIASLTKLGKTGTGPGTEQLNQIKSFFQSAGIPGIDADKITNFDEAKKSLVQFARMNGDTGTNDQLLASFAGSPNVNMSNAAATEMSKVALSLRRMKQAMTLDYANSGKPADGFSRYAATFQNNNDPRAFGYDLMSKDKQAQLIKSLGPTDSPAFQKFEKSLQLAHQYGVLGSPKSTNTSQ